MSFVLALIAIIDVGEYFPLLRADNSVLQTWPVWFICLANPVATTMVSVVLSFTMQTCFDTWSEACESEEGSTISHTTGLVRYFATITGATQRFKVNCVTITSGNMAGAGGFQLVIYARAILVFICYRIISVSYTRHRTTALY